MSVGLLRRVIGILPIYLYFHFLMTANPGVPVRQLADSFGGQATNF